MQKGNCNGAKDIEVRREEDFDKVQELLPNRVPTTLVVLVLAQLGSSNTRGNLR